MQIQQTEFIRSNRTVICHVYAALRGEQFRFTGLATCHPIDKFDLELGKEIALSRALNSLVAKLRRVSQGQVDMLDHNAHLSHKTLRDWESEKRRKLMEVNRSSDVIDPMRRVPRQVEVATA